MDYICEIPSKTNDGKTHYKIDLSILNKFENVHFILCLRPYGTRKEFEMKFVEGQENQCYKLLVFRHRNALPILIFLTFVQQNGLSNGKYPTIANEVVKKEEELPSIVRGLDHGVFWMNLKINNNSPERHPEIPISNEASNFFDNICSQIEAERLSVVFACVGTGSKALAFDIKSRIGLKLSINEDHFHDVHSEYEVNGTEADIVVYVTTSESLFIQSLARARKLLLIITHGVRWVDESKKVAGALNEAVASRKLRKI